MGRVKLVKILGIGPKIKKYRTAAMMSQRDMARELGIPYSTYSNYENGNRTPDMDTINKICEILNIGTYDLIGSITGPTNEMQTVKRPEFPNSEAEERYWAQRATLLNLFFLLNNEGQQKAISYLEDLTRIPQYQKEDDT